MSKSLAELRAMTAPKLPTASVEVCLNLELLAHEQRLLAERNALATEAAKASSDDDREGPPRKAGQPAMPPRVAEIDGELEVIYEQMREFAGEVVVRGIDGARWQEFKDANPPREGNVSDETVGYGYVNVTALKADLGRYLVSWNGEEFTGDREWFLRLVHSAEQDKIAKQVVVMHEVAVSVPKAPSTSSATPSPASDDDSPST